MKESSQLRWPTKKSFAMKLKVPKNSPEILKLSSVVQKVFAFTKMTIVTPSKTSGFKKLPGSHFVLASTPPSSSSESENQRTRF